MYGVGIVAVTTDGGNTWTVENVTPATTALSAIDCPSSSTCYAVGGGSHKRQWHGDRDHRWMAELDDGEPSPDHGPRFFDHVPIGVRLLCGGRRLRRR